MELAHRLVTDHGRRFIRDRNADGDVKRVTTGEGGNYESNLRRRRCDLKGAVSVQPSVLKTNDHHTSTVLYVIGRVAGVAWGGLTLRQFLDEFFPRGDRKSVLIGLTIHLVGFLLTVIFSLLSLLLFAISVIFYCTDELHLLVFWAASIRRSFLQFHQLDTEAQITPTAEKEKVISLLNVGSSEDKENVGPCGRDFTTTTSDSAAAEYTIFQNDLRPTIPWSGTNVITDWMFRCYFHLLCAIYGRHDLQLFRHHLSLRAPPITPLSANDTMFAFDDEHTKFQLTMLFVTDKINFEEFREAYIRRWITWEPKTRSVLTRWCGRPAWRVLENSQFDVNNHMKYIRNVDLKEKRISEVISEMSTSDIPPHLPQWEVWFIDGGEEHSFIASKWNHAYADGVGMMASIVSRLGDEPVSTTSLPDHYKREIPRWQQRLYYAYHALFAATECLQFLLYSSFGTRMNTGLITGSGYTALKCSGIKHYSTPMLARKDELQNICRNIQNAAVDRYVQKIVGSAAATSPAPGKPTINDLLCYCLVNAVAQLKCLPRVKSLLGEILDIEDVPNSHWHSEPPLKGAVNIIIPMMCRTSLPECMDNFTSLVPMVVETRRGVWRCCDNADNIQQLVEDVYHVKARLDQVKRQNCRVSLFLVFYMICKILPFNWAKAIHSRAYWNMQFCSTNVAAPSIEAKFCNRLVHGLFFWPAVTPSATCGSSWISLGNDIQVNTVLDEVELRRAVELANELLDERNQPLLSEAELPKFLDQMSGILPTLIQRELDRIKTLFSQKTQ